MTHHQHPHHQLCKHYSSLSLPQGSIVYEAKFTHFFSNSLLMSQQRSGTPLAPDASAGQLDKSDWLPFFLDLDLQKRSRFQTLDIWQTPP